MPNKVPSFLKSKIFWSRYVELVIAFIALGWLVADTSWEPIALLIGSLAALMFSEIEFLRAVARDTPAASAKIEGQQDEDRKLFEQLTALLPSDGIIGFIERHDMAGSFALDRLNPLDEFIHTWKNAEHEFLDVDLEHAKSELYKHCREFSNLIGRHISGCRWATGRACRMGS